LACYNLQKFLLGNSNDQKAIFLHFSWSPLAKKGKEIKLVRFGDPNMSIKKSQPGRRSNFRARHNCDTAKDKFSARYWSCKAW